MRTAIISDLHLGAASGEDVLRDPAVRRLLLEEIAGADRVVLLGDVVELRDLRARRRPRLRPPLLRGARARRWASAR